jgi:hypothetical protein
MRWACALTLLLTMLVLAACAEEEEWTIRPPGGGMGGIGDGPGGDDVDGGTNPGTLMGAVCVILDFENPETCPSIALATDVLVEVDATSTRSDNAAGFDIAVASLPATIIVGSEAADSLVTTLSRIATLGAAVVDVPVVDEAMWIDVQTALLVDAQFGTALIYVRDTSGNPVSGATVGYAATPTLPGTFYFDDGGGNFSSEFATTGPDGIALVIDTSSETYTATLDTRTQSGFVATTAEGIGVGVITLPDS